MEDKPFWCLKCNKTVDEVNVDGYGFGDRMLEGVMYRVKNVDGKPVLLGISDAGKVIDPKNDPYMVGLNNKHWNEICLEYCEELDIAYCPTCSEEILVWGEICTSLPPTSISITQISSIIANDPLKTSKK